MWEFKKRAISNKELSLSQIYDLTRTELIDFIKRNDNTYVLASFAWHSDGELRQFAVSIYEKMQAERCKIKNDKRNINTVR